MISGLGQGGAEESLRKLTIRTQRLGVEGLIVNLGTGGVLRPEFESAGARVEDLCISGIPTPRALFRLRRIAEQWRPDIIEGWMTHANVLATMLGSVHSSARVVWNVRASLLLSTEKLLTRTLTRSSTMLSRRADAIVYNSARAAEQYRTIGYSPRVTHIIPNGFDTQTFAGGVAQRREARAKFALTDDADVIGHISRWHPDKDLATLFDAFVRVRARHDAVLLVVAGEGLSEDNPDFMREVEARGLRGSVRALGSVRPVSTLFPAFDAFALTSLREGFPNVLGEALACGVQCVATDVGACREVIGDASVYPVGDAAGVAEGLLQILAQSQAQRDRRAQEGRARVESLFSIDELGRRYVALYESVLSAPNGKR
ncbi:MAG: glycosyltransferase [bacterium]